MGYSIKYRCTHKTHTGVEATHVLEVLQKDFTGSVSELIGTEDIALHEYEKLDINNPLANPAQSGRLEFTFGIHNATEEAILEEVFGSSESDYLLRRKINGAVVWTGTVLSDLLEYDDGPYPYSGTIKAKDLTLLEGLDFGLVEGRETIITTLAGILGRLPFSLPIRAYTSWTEANISGTDDFLNQIFNDVYALRDYAQNGDEQDQQITCQDAINDILKNYGLILRQSAGYWNLYQLSALIDPTAVRQAVYDASGDQQSFGNVDLSADVDRAMRYILPGGSNSGITPLKKVSANYNHRTKLSGIKFPNPIIIDDNQSESYSQYFTSTGAQSISLSARINVDVPSAQEVEFFYQIRAGSYYWDNNTQQWGIGSVQNSTLLSGGTLQNSSSAKKYYGFLNVDTNFIPADADGPIIIVFQKSENQKTFVSVSHFSINNTIASQANSSAIHYELTRDGDFSKTYSYDALLFGDGPVSYARGALSVDVTATVLTNEDWGRVGGATTLNVIHLLLKEIMDTRRSAAHTLQANLWGTYGPESLLIYESQSLFFLGGSLRIKENTWDATFLSIDIEDGPESFDTILKYTDGGVISSSGSAGSAPVTGSGGYNVDTLDQRYLQQTLNGSDISDADAFIENIAGLKDDFSNADFDVLDERYYTQSVIDGFLDAVPELSDDNTWTESNIFEGNTDFWQQYTDVGVNYEGSNFGIRGPRSGGGDGYLLFDASSDTWGQKFGSAGGFDPFILESDIFPDGDYQNLGSADIVNFGGGATAGNWTVGSQLNLPTGEIRNLSGSMWITPDDGSTFRVGPTTPSDEIDVIFYRIDQFGVTANSANFSNNISVGNWINSPAGEIRMDSNIWISPVNESVLLFGPSGSNEQIDVQFYRTDDFNMSANSFTLSGADMATDNFALTTDFTGTGWQGTYGGDFNIRNLTVRQAAVFRELIIDQLSAIGGSDILTAARGKIKSVDGNDITLEDPNDTGVTQFSPLDLFVVREVDVDGAEITFVAGIVKSINGMTISLYNDDADLPAEDAGGSWGSISSLKKGNVIAQRGNTSDSTRQSAIYRTATDPDSPVEKYFTNLDSLSAFNDQNNIQIVFGNTSNIDDANIDFGLFGRNFDIQAGPDYWRTSDLKGSLGDGIFSWDGQAGEIQGAGWDWIAEGFQKRQGNSRVILASDATTINLNEHAARPTLSIYNSVSEIMLNYGNIYKSPARTGIAVFDDYTTNSKVFEISKDDSTGDFYGTFLGLTISPEGMWSKNNAGIGNGGFKDDGMYFNFDLEILSLGSTLWYDGRDQTTHLGDLIAEGNISFEPGGTLTLPPNSGAGTGTLNNSGLGFAYQQDLSWSTGTGNLGQLAMDGSSDAYNATNGLNIFSQNNLGLHSLNDVHVYTGIAGIVDLHGSTLKGVRIMQKTYNHVELGSGEHDLGIDYGMVGITPTGGPRIANINLGSITPVAGMVIDFLNEGGSPFYFRDITFVNSGNRNIRTSDFDGDFEVRKGGSVSARFNGTHWFISAMHGA